MSQLETAQQATRTSRKFNRVQKGAVYNIHLAIKNERMAVDNLMVDIVLRAIQDYRARTFFDDNWKSAYAYQKAVQEVNESRESAREWLLADDPQDTYLFTFRNICEALGLNRTETLKKLGLI